MKKKCRAVEPGNEANKINMKHLCFQILLSTQKGCLRVVHSLPNDIGFFQYIGQKLIQFQEVYPHTQVSFLQVHLYLAGVPIRGLSGIKRVVSIYTYTTKNIIWLF